MRHGYRGHLAGTEARLPPGDDCNDLVWRCSEGGDTCSECHLHVLDCECEDPCPDCDEPMDECICNDEDE